MSGTINNPQPFNVANQSMPNNGAKALPIIVSFAFSTTQQVDLTLAQQRGVITNIQAVWIDNPNGTAFTLTGQNLGQTVRIGPNSQGWVPIAAPNPPVFNCTCAQGATVSLIFFNVPMPYGVYSGLSLAPRTAVDLVDRTITVDTVSMQLMPANSSRQYVYIQAPLTNDLWINPYGQEAIIDGGGSIRIPQGLAYESAGVVWGQQINVVCAVSQIITAYEA